MHAPSGPYASILERLAPLNDLCDGQILAESIDQNRANSRQTQLSVVFRRENIARVSPWSVDDINTMSSITAHTIFTHDLMYDMVSFVEREMKPFSKIEIAYGNRERRLYVSIRQQSYNSQGRELHGWEGGTAFQAASQRG